MKTPQTIENQIQDMVNHNQLFEASQLYLDVIKELKALNSPKLGEFYYNYGLLLFDMEEYEMSILMFKSAYNLSTNKSEIITFIYECFISPEQREYKQTYESVLAIYPERLMFSQIPTFEELTIDFIPLNEDKYYLFNRETMSFEGLLDTSNSKPYGEIKFADEFSDIVITADCNISYLDDLIRSSKDRNIYMIHSNLLNLLSFFKVPNFMEKFFTNFYFFDSYNNFQAFLHKNTSIYLPRICYSYINGSEAIINNIIEEEHAFRITKEGRNLDNIILSIGIPSYNRGHRALHSILSLLNSKYDSEIEFILSNNGSTINVDGYNKIENLKDSRIKYFKFEKKQGPAMNFSQIINISKGKYTCLLSDEDEIYLSGLTHYLTFLRKNPNISFLKSSGYVNYTDNTGIITPIGDESFLASLLSTNYISGLIYRTDIFHDLDLYSWTENNLSNKAVEYYGHSCWVMFYSLRGDYYEDKSLLYIERPSETNSSMTLKSKNSMLCYSTIESRIDQHNGFIEILNQFSNLIEKETFLSAYLSLCYKSFFLLTLVKEKYVSSDKTWTSVCEAIYHCAVKGISLCNMTLGKQDIDVLTNIITEYYQILFQDL